VKAGLIEIDAIPLGPFLNWEMFFAHAAEAISDIRSNAA